MNRLLCRFLQQSISGLLYISAYCPAGAVLGSHTVASLPLYAWSLCVLPHASIATRWSLSPHLVPPHRFNA